MRKLLIVGLAAALAAPAGAWAQVPSLDPTASEPPTSQDIAAPAALPPPDVAPAPIDLPATPAAPEALPAPADPAAPAVGDPAPTPQPQAAKPEEKKKAGVAETLGGAVGGVLGSTAGAAGGPLGSAAAGMVGNRVGRGVVGVVKKVFGGGKTPDEAVQQAQAAPQAAADAAATAAEPAPEAPAPEPVAVETAPSPH